MVDGKHYSKKECFVKALELNSNLATAWEDLAKVGGGVVNARFYSKAECYSKAKALKA